MVMPMLPVIPSDHPLTNLTRTQSWSSCLSEMKLPAHVENACCKKLVSECPTCTQYASWFFSEATTRLKASAPRYMRIARTTESSTRKQRASVMPLKYRLSVGRKSPFKICSSNPVVL